MRIAIVCAAGVVFGKETIALELADGLRQNGSKVKFVTSLWNDGTFLRRLAKFNLEAQAMRLGFISATLNLDSLWMTADQMWHWPGLLVDYRRFLRQETPERVVHTNWHHLLLLWPFLEPNRDFFWLHESIPDTSQYRLVFRWLSRRIGCFITVSHAVAESLRKINIPNVKIRVVHNGYSDPVPVGGCAPRISKGTRIGIAGQMTPAKGHEDLLDAFALVAAKHPIAELHIFGRGQPDFESKLKQRGGLLGIEPRLIWRGYVPDRSTIYSEVDIFSVPSRGPDPLPGVAVEAAFFGLPVVASRRGGLPEIIDDGITGFLVEAENPPQLAARLDELLGSSELRKKMGDAARARALTYFCRKRFIEDFVRLLSEGSHNS